MILLQCFSILFIIIRPILLYLIYHHYMYLSCTKYSFSLLTMSLANVISFHFIGHKMDYDADIRRIWKMFDEVSSSEDEETVEGVIPASVTGELCELGKMK